MGARPWDNKKKNLWKLTPLQMRFCEEYVVDLNATQAALRTGYSPATAGSIGHNLLKKIEIQNYIQHLNSTRSNTTGITAARVLEEIAALGFANMKDFIEFKKGKKPRMKSFDEMPDTRAIKKMKIRERKIISDAAGGDTEEELGNTGDEQEPENCVIESHVEFELYDKIRPLDMLSKHLGLYEEGAGDGDNEADETELIDALGEHAESDWADEAQDGD